MKSTQLKVDSRLDKERRMQWHGAAPYLPLISAQCNCIVPYLPSSFAMPIVHSPYLQAISPNSHVQSALFYL